MVEVKRNKYAGILANDMADGEGVCVSFWVQGCPIHCPGCHNQQTWDFEGGLDLPSNYLDLIDQAISANGVHRNFSLLGGEPLSAKNLELSYTILKHVRSKFPSIKIFCWTGYTLELLSPEQRKCLQFIDTLIDGPYIQEQRDITLKLRGSTNQKIRQKGVDF